MFEKDPTFRGAENGSSTLGITAVKEKSFSFFIAFSIIMTIYSFKLALKKKLHKSQMPALNNFH